MKVSTPRVRETLRDSFTVSSHRSPCIMGWHIVTSTSDPSSNHPHRFSIHKGSIDPHPHSYLVSQHTVADQTSSSSSSSSHGDLAGSPAVALVVSTGGQAEVQPPGLQGGRQGGRQGGGHRGRLLGHFLWKRENGEMMSTIKQKWYQEAQLLSRYVNFLQHVQTSPMLSSVHNVSCVGVEGESGMHLGLEPD